MTSSDDSVEVSHEELLALKNRVEKLEQENQDLREENKRLRAKLRWHEGPHTPSSQKQSDSEESSSSDEDEDDEEPLTDGGTPGRKSGHDPEWRPEPDPDEVVEVTCDCCPDCGEQFDESEGVSPQLVEEIPDPCGNYPVQPTFLRVRLVRNRDGGITPRLPLIGAVRGERHRAGGSFPI